MGVLFAEIESSAREPGIMINCQLDDQIESPADFSHFDPICLALAPPTSPAPDRRRPGGRTGGRAEKRSSMRPQQQLERGGGGGEEEEEAAAVGSCDGRDFRRRRPWRSPSLTRSQSLNPSSSFFACLPARPRRPPPPPPARLPSCNHIPTDLRRWNSQLQSLQDSSEGQTDFFSRAQRPARFDTALP